MPPAPSGCGLLTAIPNLLHALRHHFPAQIYLPVVALVSTACLPHELQAAGWDKLELLPDKPELQADSRLAERDPSSYDPAR